MKLRTKLKPGEEITKELPYFSEKALHALNDSGLIAVGKTVKAGDILVGKVTPQVKPQLSSEEKMVRTIFGETAINVVSTSLHLPPAALTGVSTATVKKIERGKDELIIQLKPETLNSNTAPPLATVRHINPKEKSADLFIHEPSSMSKYQSRINLYTLPMNKLTKVDKSRCRDISSKKVTK
jgi:DNA-directed RNA polymerase beta subunit